MLGSAGSSQVVVLVLTLLLKKRTTGDESTHSRERAQGCTLALLFAVQLCSCSRIVEVSSTNAHGPKILCLGAYPRCHLSKDLPADCRNAE